MSLIDTSYFINEINVPLTGNATLDSTFNNALTKYEPEVLKKLLGYPLYKEMTEAIAADALGEGAEGYVALPQKWSDFINGAEFTFDLNGQTITEYWNGLANTSKESLIAYYVYYKHRTNSESKYTGVAEVSGQSENSKKVSPLNKLVRVHSLFLYLYGKIPAYAYRYFSSYPVSGYQHYTDQPSAYNFLLANSENYAAWRFTPIGNVNAFGI